MSKFNDFYKKVMEDEKIKAEVIEVLGDDTFEKASDEKLAKIGEIAKKAGYEFTLEEAKAHFEGGELDEDELDAVAGGKGGGGDTNIGGDCVNGVGGSQIVVHVG